MTPDYLLIPYQLISDQNVTPLEEKIYAVVYWLTRMKLERCIASNELIGKIAKCSPDSAKRGLAHLEELGYIKRIFNNHGERVEIEALVSFLGGTDQTPRGGRAVTGGGLTRPQSSNTYTEDLINTVAPSDDVVSYEEVDEDGNAIKRKKPKVSKLSPAKPKSFKFDFNTELQKLAESRIHADKVIALYFHFKGITFDNPLQMQEQVKRNSKSAKVLDGYNADQIEKTMWECDAEAKKLDYIWTLETVGKKIININKKNARG